jgi:hypothetical protein
MASDSIDYESSIYVVSTRRNENSSFEIDCAFFTKKVADRYAYKKEKDWAELEVKVEQVIIQ